LQTTSKKPKVYTW